MNILQSNSLILILSFSTLLWFPLNRVNISLKTINGHVLRSRKPARCRRHRRTFRTAVGGAEGGEDPWGSQSTLSATPKELKESSRAAPFRAIRLRSNVSMPQRLHTRLRLNSASTTTRSRPPTRTPTWNSTRLCSRWRIDSSKEVTVTFRNRSQRLLIDSLLNLA